MEREIDLSKLNKKQRRRVLFLISTVYIIYSQPLPKVEEYTEDIYGKERTEYLIELHKLFDIANLSYEERNIYFQKYRLERRKIRTDYDAKPIRESKDNKDFYNGTGGSNKNKVRYPKKCRKTAWKRFAKLFPHLVKVKKGKIVKKKKN